MLIDPHEGILRQGMGLTVLRHDPRQIGIVRGMKAAGLLVSLHANGSQAGCSDGLVAIFSFSCRAEYCTVTDNTAYVFAAPIVALTVLIKQVLQCEWRATWEVNFVINR